MADSYVTATGDGTAGPFSFSVLDYLDIAHIGVKVDGEEQTLTENYTISGTDVTFVSGYEPAATIVIKIYRATPRSKANRLVDFADGTVLHEGDLDTAALQNLYIAQEAFEESGNAVSYDASLGAYTASSLEIKNLAEPTTDSSAASRKYVTDTASFGVPGIPQQDNSTFDGSTTQRTLVGWTGVSQSMVLAALDGVVQIPGTDFSLDEVGVNTVLTVIGVTQGALEGVKLNVQNFGVAKSSNTIDDGSVTEAKLATDAVTASKIAANAVGSSEIAENAVGLSEIGFSAVTMAHIKNTGFTDNNITGNTEFLKVASNTSDLSLGTLTAAEISDLNSTLNSKPISIFAAATGNVVLGNGITNYKIVNLASPTAAADAATRGYVLAELASATVAPSFMQVNGAVKNLTNTGWTNTELTLGPTYDPAGRLSLNTSTDSITLTKGFVYAVAWCGGSILGTNLQANYLYNRLATASTGGTTYLQRDFTNSSGTANQGFAWYSDGHTLGPMSIIDLTSAGTDVTVKHYCKCENSNGPPRTTLSYLVIRQL